MRNRSFSPIIALVLLLVPGAAAAQLVTELSVTLSPARINPANCDSNVTITAAAKANGAPVTGLEGSDRWLVAVLPTGTNCEDGEEVDFSDFTAVATTPGSYRTTVRARDLIETGSALDCSSITGTQRVNVCVIWDNASGDDPDARASFSVDTRRPDAPVLNRVEPGDSKLRLSFEPVDNKSPDSWEVCYRPVATDSTFALSGAPRTWGLGGAGGVGGDPGVGGAGGAGGDPGIGGIGGIGGEGGLGGEGGVGGEGGLGGEGGVGGEGGTGGIGGTGGTGGVRGQGGDGGAGGTPGPDLCAIGSVRSGISGSRRTYSLEGLRNGTTYQVAVRAIDDAGNVSALSNILEGTPQEVADFWDLYRNAGGGEEGGCSSAAGPATLGLLCAGLFLFRRRNDRR